MVSVTAPVACPGWFLPRRDVVFSPLLLVVRFHPKGYLTLNPNSWWSWVWKFGTVVGFGAGVVEPALPLTSWRGQWGRWVLVSSEETERSG